MDSPIQHRSHLAVKNYNLLIHNPVLLTALWTSNIEFYCWWWKPRKQLHARMRHVTCVPISDIFFFTDFQYETILQTGHLHQSRLKLDKDPSNLTLHKMPRARCSHHHHSRHRPPTNALCEGKEQKHAIIIQGVSLTCLGRNAEHLFFRWPPSVRLRRWVVPSLVTRKSWTLPPPRYGILTSLSRVRDPAKRLS